LATVENMSKRQKNSSQARRGDTRTLDARNNDLDQAEQDTVRLVADNQRDRGRAGTTDRKAKARNERRR
jgi:hypothetical protein